VSRASKGLSVLSDLQAPSAPKVIPAQLVLLAHRGRKETRALLVPLARLATKDCREPRATRARLVR